eukprot:6319176-Prymnesium_polylepis.2
MLAAVPWQEPSAAGAVYASSDAGDTFAPWSTGLSWGGRVPFYPTIALGASHVFVGALTVRPTNLSDTASGLFVRPLSELHSPTADAAAGWAPVANTPRLDRDGMPKDRMALLVNPDDEATLFVAGNADALVWR